MATVRNGTPGNDLLQGTAVDDLFMASPGDDRFAGNDGDDMIDYELMAGPIEAVFTGELIGSVTKIGVGADKFTSIHHVYGTAFADRLNGWAGTVTFVHLRGMAGNDTIDGAGNIHNIVDYTDSPAAVFVDLAAGFAKDGFGTTDTLLNTVRIHGSAFDDTLLGAATNDGFEVTDRGAHFIDGRGGFNALRYVGNAGIVIDLGTTPTASGGHQGTVTKPNGLVDTLIDFNGGFGDRGDDTILGSLGDDVLGGLSGNNRLDGRGGYNTANYHDYYDLQPTHGVRLDLAAGTATNPWDGHDTLIGMQAAEGSHFNDTMTGADLGGGLLSRLRGLEGNDILQAPAAGALVVADYSADPAGVRVDLTMGSATDGWGDRDTLVGIHVVLGSAFTDTLSGGAGNDRLDGGDGIDMVVFGGDRASYFVSLAGAVITVQDLHGATGGGTDTLENIELFAFSDGTVTKANLLVGNSAELPPLATTGTVFDFNTVADSAKATPRTLDWHSGDHIDLSDVPLTGIGHPAALHWAGIDPADATKAYGVWEWGDGSGMVRVDITGDGQADMAILLRGAPVLTAADLILVASASGGTTADPVPPATSGTVFNFNTVADSPKATPRTLDWHSGDHIDLSDVPLTGIGHPAALHWAGIDPADATKAYGVWEWGDGSGMVRVDITGDGQADMAILLRGAPVLTAADLIFA